MFDITSSKLLLLGIVALLVIGPKDLPGLLRTIGKYVGMIKKQAAEFRSQFDEAMRESELAELKKDMEKLQQETEATVRSAELSVEKQMSDVETSVKSSLDPDLKLTDPLAPVDPLAPPDPLAHDPDGLPAPKAEPAVETASGLNGASHPDKSAEAKAEAAGEPGTGVKTGA